MVLSKNNSGTKSSRSTSQVLSQLVSEWKKECNMNIKLVTISDLKLSALLE